MDIGYARVICVLLHEVEYSLQAPAKTVEGRNHPTAMVPSVSQQPAQDGPGAGVTGGFGDAIKKALVAGSNS
jgi:hypothetical protein